MEKLIIAAVIMFFSYAAIGIFQAGIDFFRVFKKEN